MKKKVWIIMESWEEENLTMGYVNSVYDDCKEAVKAKKILAEYNKKCRPNVFYANWIVEKTLYYAK